jgi:CheY-like chemotaxis protein
VSWPVLIVDDEEDIRDGLAAILRARGYRTWTAANGNEALALIRGGAVVPSAILLDLAMPELDGFGFLAAQAAEPTCAQVPVVVVTAHASEAGEMPSQVWAVIEKPLDLRRLLTVLHDACGR